MFTEFCGVNPAFTTVLEKVKLARHVIRQLLEQGHPLILSYSGGKDSSVITNIALTVAAELPPGQCPDILLLHADTRVENPEMVSHVRIQTREIKEFADVNGISLGIHVSQPTLANHWAVKVIGGKVLPTLPASGGSAGGRQCSVDWKGGPLRALTRDTLKSMKQSGYEAVRVSGTRKDESAVRRKKMEKRGETSQEVWSDGQELCLSPIAEWSDVDVWTYLQMASAGKIHSYSNFESLKELYLAGSTDTRLTDGVIVPSCRFGCAVCCVGRDKSMAGLLESNPQKYGYMDGLHRLQKFILATAYDWSRRQWVNRGLVNERFIKIMPDVYSPSMLAELLRFSLSLDELERSRAYRGGFEPRYELVPPNILLAIDAQWSMYGYHRPFEALRIYRDVVLRGNLELPPDVPLLKKTRTPKAKYFPVPEKFLQSRFTGLWNPVLEAVGDSCIGLRTLSNGNFAYDNELSQQFWIPEESADLVLGLELDYLLDRQCGSRASGYHYYQALGALVLSNKGQSLAHDRILQNTGLLEKLGLAGLEAHEIERTVSPQCLEKAEVGSPFDEFEF